MLYPCTGVWVDAQKGIPGAILNSKRRELFRPKSPVCERLGERAGSVNPARNSLLGSERPAAARQVAWPRVSRSGSGIRRLGVAAHSRTGNRAWRGRVQSCPVEPDDFGKRPLLDGCGEHVHSRAAYGSYGRRQVENRTFSITSDRWHWIAARTGPDRCPATEARGGALFTTAAGTPAPGQPGCIRIAVMGNLTSEQGDVTAAPAAGPPPIPSPDSPCPATGSDATAPNPTAPATPLPAAPA